jgi:hypothetical protein
MTVKSEPKGKLSQHWHGKPNIKVAEKKEPDSDETVKADLRSKKDKKRAKAMKFSKVAEKAAKSLPKRRMSYYDDEDEDD